MEWLSAINVPELTGWGAFVALSAFVVTGFMKEMIYPRGVVKRFEDAWKAEREIRIAMDESRYPALKTAIETNTQVVDGLKSAFEQSTAKRREESR